VRREDYFVTSANSCGAKAEDQSISGVADTESVRDSKVSRERILELGKVALLNESTATEYVADDLDEFFFTRGECAAIVEEGDRGLS